MPKVTIVFPDHFLCPITGQPMFEPVETADGYIYDKGAITTWLQNHNTSPCTNKQLANKALIPSTLIKNQILTFLHSNYICSPEEFFSAVKSNNIPKLKQLNYLAIYLELKDKDGKTLIEWAKENKKQEMETFLMSLLKERENLIESAALNPLMTEKLYARYLDRLQNPQSYVDYLQSEIDFAKSQTIKVTARLQKLQSEVVEFNGVFQQFKLQSDGKIADLQENLWSEKKQNETLQNELSSLREKNANLAKQVLGLQTQNMNLDLQDRKLNLLTQQNAMLVQQIRELQNLKLDMEIDDGKSEEETLELSNKSKLIPDGLIAIYKTIGTDLNGKKRIFGNVKLVFTNQEKAEKFKEQWNNYFKYGEHPFRLLYENRLDESFTDIILYLNFTNCQASFFANKHHEKYGEIMLAEFKKYVDISHIPQEFRNAWRNGELQEKDLPDEYKSSEHKSPKLFQV